MFEYPTRLGAALAGLIVLNLLLAVAALAGVVPHAVDGQTVAALATVDDPAVVAPAAAAEPAPVPASEPAPEPEPTPASRPPAAAAVVPAAPATTAAPEPPPAPAPTAPATTAPTIPARKNPSSAQVQAGINQLRARNPLFNVTESQARQFADQVCSAFDAGSSYSSVRAQVMQAAAGVPLVTITAADADFAIRNAVQLFCPNYLSKLP